MISDIPRAPSASSDVRASKHSQSAWTPLVMKSFEPLMTHSSPSRTARVRIPATSLPASGSVTAMDVTTSPRMAGSRYRAFRASLPYRCNAGVDMDIWTAIAIGTPPQLIRPSSSAAMSVKEWSAAMPPYASSYSRPNSPTAPSLGKRSWAGKIRAASHASTCGSISRSNRSRSVLRNN